jgi:hypothetical protein
MHLQRLWRGAGLIGLGLHKGCVIKMLFLGMMLDAIYTDKLSLDLAKEMVNPSVSKSSFYALFTM